MPRLSPTSKLFVLFCLPGAVLLGGAILQKPFVMVLGVGAFLIAIPASFLILCPSCGRMVVETLYRAQLRGRPALYLHCHNCGAPLYQGR
jgi:hypothetical protein